MPLLAILFVVLAWAPLGCSNAAADAANINSMGFNPWDPHCRSSRYHRSYANGRIWLDVGVLGWSAKGGGKLPALVTASPGGTPLSDAGALGFPTTDLLLGGSKVFDAMRIGGRVRGGWWFDLEHTVGIEGSYFGVDGENILFHQAGNGVDILARPFFNIDTGQQDARLVAFPATVIGPDTVTAEGTIRVDATTALSGGEVVLRRLINGSSTHRLELVAGYRHVHLADRLYVTEEIDVTTLQAGATVQEVGDLVDSFRATNNFHGGELGIIASRWWNRLSLQGMAKVALGGSSRRIDIRGRTAGNITTTPAVGTPTTVPFDVPVGLLAQDSNIGTFDDAEFAVSTELGVNLEYAVTCQLKLAFGYTFLYLPEVARVMDQIDTAIDPTQAQPRPRLPFATTDYWAQGLQGSLVCQF